MADTLEDLARRCESATAADRELDVAIVYGMYPDIGNYEGQCVGDPPIFWHDPYRKQPCPNFTASLDAAMTLVPEGWDISAGRKNGEGHAYIHNRQSIFVGVGCRKNPCRKSEEVTAATPALALCAAALRAIAKERG